MGRETSTHGAAIELNVLLEPEDYLRANYWFLFKKFRLFLLVLLVIGLVYPLLYLAGPLGPPMAELESIPWGLFTPLVILILLLVATYIGARRSLASNKSLQEEIHYSFSTEGIKAVGASSEGFTAWRNIRDAFETRHNFLLFISNNQMYTIPKRCFTGAARLPDFRNLLVEVLGPRARLK